MILVPNQGHLMLQYHMPHQDARKQTAKLGTNAQADLQLCFSHIYTFSSEEAQNVKAFWKILIGIIFYGYH